MICICAFFMFKMSQASYGHDTSPNCSSLEHFRLLSLMVNSLFLGMDSSMSFEIFQEAVRIELNRLQLGCEVEASTWFGLWQLVVRYCLLYASCLCFWVPAHPTLEVVTDHFCLPQVRRPHVSVVLAAKK